MIDLTEFFTRGWICFEEPNLHLREDFTTYLANKYLSMFPSWELIECFENFKVEEWDKITEWHNDGKFGMNITFLYYIDEMSPKTGGAIFIRNETVTEMIYPKSGTLIMMSQKPNVLHRVEPCSIQRHMFNIDFAVKGF